MQDTHASPSPDDGPEPLPAADGASTGDGAATDPLLERLRRIQSMPVADRADAIESLNRSVVTALGELEQL